MPLNQHFRKQWEARGYPTNMGSAAVVPPPPKGYRRVYHLTSAEYAISNIVFSRLKVARFSDLNDPFELLAHANDKSVRRTIGAHKDQLAMENGLLCFSGDWTDPVLWTHYGAKHRGICLGFDLKEEIAKEVLYQKERLVGKIEKGINSIDSDLADLLLRTKFVSWRYEKEWRVLVSLTDAIQEGELFFYPFGKQFRLVEVILGSLSSLSFSELRQLTTTHHPKAVTIQARLASLSFNIVPREKTVRPFP